MLAIFLFVPLMPGRAGIIVNLGTVDVELGPDGHTTRQLEVSNTEEKSAEITVFAADWNQDETGAVEAIDPSAKSTPDSASGWIGVNPQRFVLKKGEKKIVTISLATPKQADSMSLKEYRSMIFTQTTETKEETPAPGRQMRVEIIGRIGTKIFVHNPSGPVTLDCAVTKMQETTRDEKRGLEIRASNRGNVHVQSDASKLAFRDGSGATIETQSIAPFSILTGHERTVFVELPEPGKSKLEKGKKYSALAVVDYGGSDLVAGELEFTY